MSIKKVTVVHKEEIFSWMKMMGICHEHNEPQHRMSVTKLIYVAKLAFAYDKSYEFLTAAIK